MRQILISLLFAVPAAAATGQPVIFAAAPEAVGHTGVSGLWVLANISYAGMRAQNSKSTGWRVISFIFGLPGTLITYFAVSEGGERAYGIDLPKKRNSI